MPLAAGSLIASLGLLLLGVAHGSTGEIVLFSALMFSGIGLAFAAMPNLIMEAVPPSQTGEATGFNALVRSVGASVGTQVTATILTAQHRRGCRAAVELRLHGRVRRFGRRRGGRGAGRRRDPAREPAAARARIRARRDGRGVAARRPCARERTAAVARGIALRVEPGRMAAKPPHESLIDRRVRKIVNARSVTLGLAVTFVLLALVGAVVERIVDPHDFPSIGLALWWSLQTVTTVGYGDVVPTTDIGRLVGGIELVLSVSFIAFLTAGVTSAVVERSGAESEELKRDRQEQDARTIVEALAETREAIAALDRRLDSIESKLAP